MDQRSSFQHLKPVSKSNPLCGREMRVCVGSEPGLKALYYAWMCCAIALGLEG